MKKIRQLAILFVSFSLFLCFHASVYGIGVEKEGISKKEIKERVWVNPNNKSKKKYFDLFAKSLER